MSKANTKVQIQVGNCINEIPKSELPASAAIEGGNYPFFCSSSEPKQIDIFIQEKPAILLGTGGVASVNFVNDKFSYSTDTWGIRSSCPELPIEFLYWKLQQLLPEIDYKGFEGSGLRHLRKNYIRSLSFEVSQNRYVSKKVATILTTIDTAIKKTQELTDKYQKIKTGLMNDLFTRGIGADGKLRPPRSEAPKLYKKTKLGWIPKEWSWDYLENLLAPIFSNMRSGPFGSALLKSELVENGIPFLGIDNVFKECFVDSYKRFVSEKKFSELFRYAVRPKDVTITIMGTVGRSAVIPSDIGKALSSKHLWSMTFDESRYYPELICWQLNYASWVLSWFRRETQGGIMDAIQSKTLKKVKLPLPKIEEQEEILKYYSNITEKIESEKNYLSKLQKQKAGLMQDLLTGKVEVTVPDEEVVND